MVEPPLARSRALLVTTESSPVSGSLRGLAAALARLALATAFIAVPLAGCDIFNHGEEDLAGLIGTQFVPLSIDDAGVEDGVITSEALVAPASFLTAVKKQFGHDFSRVELSAVRLRIQTPTITAWSAVYSGEVSVAFVPSSNPVAIVVAHGSAPAGVSDFVLDVTASKTAFDDYPDIAKGNFRIQVSGATPKSDTDTFAQPVVVEVEFLVF